MNGGEGEITTSNICEAMHILGAKWSYLVISELTQGPRRYNQMLRNLSVVKPQSLTNTLRKLEERGIVKRKVHDTIPVTVEYSLTEKGKDFQSMLVELDKWASRWKNQSNKRE